MDTFDKILFSAKVRQSADELGRRGVGALGKLFDLTAPRLARFAMAMTHNRHDAEDVLQAALVKLAQNPRALCDAWHPWAYLLRVVRNEALRLCQKKKSLKYFSKIIEDGGADPSAAEEGETRTIVREALAKLPPEQSEVIVLKIWEEMTFLEIAEVLGESQNTVASRYRYAIQKLQRHLQPLAREAVRG